MRFQAWVMRFESQGVLRRPADPEGHCAGLNTYGGGVSGMCVCVCTRACVLNQHYSVFFIKSPGPPATVVDSQGIVCAQGHRWTQEMGAKFREDDRRGLEAWGPLYPWHSLCRKLDPSTLQDWAGGSLLGRQ